MRKKSLIAKRKVNLKNLTIKNPEINKIYKDFKTVISKHINKKDFALGVSGGSDSLCLAYFSKIYSLEFKNKIHILIVSHTLRKESYKEALKVGKILKKKEWIVKF